MWYNVFWKIVYNKILNLRVDLIIKIWNIKDLLLLYRVLKK